MAVRSDMGQYTLYPKWVEDVVADHTARSLYTHLGLRCWGDDGWAISRAQLAIDMRVSVSTIKRVTKLLVEAGALEVFPTTTSLGDQGWNRYKINHVKPRHRPSRGFTHEPRSGHQRAGVGSPVNPLSRRDKQIQESTPLTPLPGGKKGPTEKKGTAECAGCGGSGVRSVDVHRHRTANGKTMYLHEGCTASSALNPIDNYPTSEEWT